MTDQLRQAAQQALECIERLNAHGWILADFEDEVYAAITALRTALEQQAEPVALHEAVISAWSLREVYFDEDGEPSMHRSPPQRPWVGLTDEEVQFYTEKHRALVNAHYDKMADTNTITEAFDSIGFYKEIAAALKERNT